MPSKRTRLLLAALAILLPIAARAQDATVYSSSELDKPPALVSTEMTARLLARSYPAALRRAGVTGTVQVQFIVDQTGKVEPNSIQIVSSSLPALSEAAKGIVTEISFRPGQLNGQPVKSAVILPIVYK